jgi:molecular chaperone GrpE
MSKANNGGKEEGDIEVEVVEGEIMPDPGAGAEAAQAANAGAPATEAEALAAQNAELLDSLVRLKADFENYRKRMIKEQTHILDTAEAGLVKKLLPVIDNLERALASAEETGAAGLKEGVEKVLELMVDTLEREGLEVIDPEGEPFDPEHHEAMMVVETDDCAEDTVLDVIQKGYRFSGVLLRPAMVKVSCPVKR